jgi:hypothetical protein
MLLRHGPNRERKGFDARGARPLTPPILRERQARFSLMMTKFARIAEAFSCSAEDGSRRP